MVKYGTRPVRDVDTFQYYGKIRHPSNQGFWYIAVLWWNTAPVQSGILLYCSIIVKKNRHPSSHWLFIIAVIKKSKHWKCWLRHAWWVNSEPRRILWYQVNLKRVGIFFLILIVRNKNILMYKCTFHVLATELGIKIELSDLHISLFE